MPELFAPEGVQLGPPSDDEWNDDHPMAVAAETLDLEASFGISGLMHIIHNATSDIKSSMKHYSDHVNDMKLVADLVRRRHTRQRLFETCYTDETGFAMRPFWLASMGNATPTVG
eukprot:7637361-Alexandrium_andersonii.AAC.1